MRATLDHVLGRARGLHPTLVHTLRPGVPRHDHDPLSSGSLLFASLALAATMQHSPQALRRPQRQR
jgi:hypothetical protein